MKDISYRCNLCKNKKDINELVPLNWFGSYGNEKLELYCDRNCADYNNHLCLSCLGSLKNFLTRPEWNDKL